MPDFGEFRILVDTPSATPGLNFDAYARALAHAIANSRPQFAIGIYGPWGSGKTTLMNAVRSKLNQANTVVVEFSAWRYEKEQHLLVPLLDTIREALVNWANAREKEQSATEAERQNRAKLVSLARATAATIGMVATSIVAGISFSIGAPGSIELSFEAAKALERAREFDREAEKKGFFSRSSRRDGGAEALIRERGNATFPQSVYHTCFRELQNIFGHLRRNFTNLLENDGDLRFVVFVDDLDRCLPTGALEVLEAIKLFFEHEGFVFVVGLDRSIVERFVEQSYPQLVVLETVPATDAGKPPTSVEKRRPLVSGTEYIKKIFQVPFTLAPVQLSQLEDLVNAIHRGDELKQEQVDDLRNRVLPHLRVAFGEAAVNPREVKRYINAYVLQMKIKELLDPDMVLALQTINSRLDWDRIREAIEVHRDEFMRALREDLAYVQGQLVLAPGEVKPLELLDPKLATLPQSFIDYVAFDFSVGRILCNEHEGARIAEYLYSVESTTTAHGGVLLDILPMLTRARRDVKSAPNKIGDQAKQAYARAREELSKALSRLGSIEAQGDLRALRSQLEVLTELMLPPPESGLEVGNSTAEAHSESRLREIDALIQRVRVLRRQSSLGNTAA
jgi:hypothetical protein